MGEWVGKRGDGEAEAANEIHRATKTGWKRWNLEKVICCFFNILQLPCPTFYFIQVPICLRPDCVLTTARQLGPFPAIHELQYRSIMAASHEVVRFLITSLYLSCKHRDTEEWRSYKMDGCEEKDDLFDYLSTISCWRRGRILRWVAVMWQIQVLLRCLSHVGLVIDHRCCWMPW